MSSRSPKGGPYDVFLGRRLSERQAKELSAKRGARTKVRPKLVGATIHHQKCPVKEGMREVGER
jgi:hypothetical protein